MLRYLKISHLAIIDKVEVEFHEGFNVLTGETGAGKSIIIGALDLLLGSKASPDLIRAGEEEAQVEALFEVPEGAALPDDVEYDREGVGELILTRRFGRSGRSRCSVNGNLCTVGMLRAAGRALVSIFGQHEHHVLLDPAEHADILDRFGGLEDKRTETARAFAAWSKSGRDLARADKTLDDLERRERENAESVDELTKATLKPGEDEKLLSERDILKNAVQIREKAFDAYHNLYAKSGSLIEGLSEVRKAVDYLAAADSRFAHMHENLDDAVYRLEDVALELRGVTESVRSDPARLEGIEERLTLIRRLKKKYGRDVEGLIAHLEILAEEAGDILEARNAVKNLKVRVAQAKDEYFSVARDLAAARHEAARKLEAAMKEELKELAMAGASFTVSFTDLGESGASAGGTESLEFFLTSNPGEDARPLARIASGGELSRIMLALKALQVGGGGTSTVIFDEVDTGIGGHTAFAVGTRLARVAKSQQVLCITHLHQIAALADHHFSVRKSVSKGRTRIEVSTLDEKRRLEELARMLGAPPDSESVKEHVRRLMDLGSAEVSS
jgi:DNA repair protein RecN (Recombination protein N)